jgi:hypothetical protein
MTEPEEEEVWNRKKWLSGAVACLSVLSLLGVGVTAKFVLDQRSYNDCQRGHNDSVQASIRQRAEANDLTNAAIRTIAQSGADMVRIILPPSQGQPVPTPEERIAAVQRWQEAQITAAGQLAKAEEQRRDNPLPGARQC